MTGAGTGALIAGRYSLDHEIGRGGMGAVWCGTDQTLGRTVALKRVGVAPGGADTDVRRAEREARLAARLNHPHVVAVFDLVDDGDQQWMVMEHVEGTNLSHIVRTQGFLAPDQVAPILAQVADALAAAHSAGIVHRDVKPSNILVAQDGTVKLTDFGIARTEADAALTQTGLVTGSPAYLSPEVATGRTATEASDVWSLGATLCHALTGRTPYEVGDNVMGALYRIVHEEPPRPDNAGWLAPLLEATMVKEPERRWSAARARDFLAAGPSAVAAVDPEPTRTMPLAAVPAAVAPVAAAPPPPTPAEATPTPGAVPPVPAPPRRTPLPLVVVASLVVLALTIGAFWWGSRSGDDGEREPSADDTPSQTGGGQDEQPTPTTPTAEEMEGFVADYLDLVVSDPEAAFDLLTPGFQDASGGLDGYLGFWGTVRRTDLLDVSADPETMVVDYTYRYQTDGGGRPITDDVSLQLEQTSDGLRIAGEA